MSRKVLGVSIVILIYLTPFYASLGLQLPKEKLFEVLSNYLSFGLSLLVLRWSTMVGCVLGAGDLSSSDRQLRNFSLVRTHTRTICDHSPSVCVVREVLAVRLPRAGIGTCTPGARRFALSRR